MTTDDSALLPLHQDNYHQQPSSPLSSSSSSPSPSLVSRPRTSTPIIGISDPSRDHPQSASFANNSRPVSPSTLDLAISSTNVNDSNSNRNIHNKSTEIMMVGQNITQYTQTLPPPLPFLPPPYSQHYPVSTSDQKVPSNSPTASSFVRPSLPRPDYSGRMPVRMGLSDPRVHIFLGGSKNSPPMELPSSLTRPSRPPAAARSARSPVAALSSHHSPPMAISRSGTRSMLDDDTGQMTIRRDFELYGPDSTHSHEDDYAGEPTVLSGHGTAHGHGLDVDTRSSTVSAGAVVLAAAAAPRSSLPSPAPSVALSPDWVFSSSNRSSPSNHHHYGPHHPVAPVQPSSALQQRQLLKQHQPKALDLVSPSCSEADLSSDTKSVLTPLFPSSPPLPAYGGPHLSPRPSSATGVAHVPMSSNRSYDRTSETATTPMSCPPASSSPHLTSGPTSSLSLSAATLAGLKTSTSPPQRPLPLHHPHKQSAPTRAPERSGQDVIRTSSLEISSSQYVNLDYYDICRQSPRQLRPEGGRRDAEKYHPYHHSQQPHRGASQLNGAMMEGRSVIQSHHKSRSQSHANDTFSSSVPRRQSAPFVMTAQGGLERHSHYDDSNYHGKSHNGGSDVPIHGKRYKPSSSSSLLSRKSISDIPTRTAASSLASLSSSLAMSSTARTLSSSPSSSSATTPTTTTTGSTSTLGRPAAMSIRHILADDSEGSDDEDQQDDDAPDNGGGNWARMSGGGVGHGHHKKSPSESSTVMELGEDGRKKRTRMSKKRAATLGLLDADGNIISSRKRPKKLQDSDHTSSSGFSHGGERVVQEPDELVVLPPDVGPVDLLDVEAPPTVHWKGQPLSILGKAGVEYLHPHEIKVASTLRLSPAQYLNCKKTIILASREYFAIPNGKAFRKSDAQKMCRIDVNKTSRLWEFFARVGWLEGIDTNDV